MTLPHGEHRHEHPATREHSLFIPLLLVVLALLGWFCFQAAQLFQERATLEQAHAAQQGQVDQSQKVRDSLDALARDTARLAEQGNANARLVVDELGKRGITINPENPPPAK